LIARDDARKTAGCRRVDIAIARTIYGQFLSSTQPSGSASNIISP